MGTNIAIDEDEILRFSRAFAEAARVDFIDVALDMVQHAEMLRTDAPDSYDDFMKAIHQLCANNFDALHKGVARSRLPANTEIFCDIALSA